MAKLILIKTFLHRHEAEVAKGLLKENKIEAVISADDVGGSIPMASLGTGNVKLLVQEEDAAKAKEFLLVLDSFVDGELWEEDPTLANLPKIKNEPIETKKENSFNTWTWLILGVIILAIIYIFLKK